MTNTEIITALNRFAVRGIAAEADARAFCTVARQALGAGFSTQKFLDNFYIAARVNDERVQ